MEHSNDQMTEFEEGILALFNSIYNKDQTPSTFPGARDFQLGNLLLQFAQNWMKKGQRCYKERHESYCTNSSESYVRTSTQKRAFESQDDEDIDQNAFVQGLRSAKKPPPNSHFMASPVMSFGTSSGNNSQEQDDSQRIPFTQMSPVFDRSNGQNPANQRIDLVSQDMFSEEEEDAPPEVESTSSTLCSKSTNKFEGERVQVVPKSDQSSSSASASNAAFLQSFAQTPTSKSKAKSSQGKKHVFAGPKQQTLVRMFRQNEGPLVNLYTAREQLQSKKDKENQMDKDYDQDIINAFKPHFESEEDNSITTGIISKTELVTNHGFEDIDMDSTQFEGVPIMVAGTSCNSKEQSKSEEKVVVDEEGEVVEDEEEEEEEEVLVLDERNQLARDFDEPPKPQSSPTYAYVPKKAIRGKKERAKLPGWDCDLCVEYYRGLESELGAEELEKLKNKCSRHRSKFPYRKEQETPEGYWRTDFPSSESCRELGIGYYKQGGDDEDKDEDI